MNYLGIEASVRNLPELDRDFFPLYKFNHAFLASAKKPLGVAVHTAVDHDDTAVVALYDVAHPVQAYAQSFKLMKNGRHDISPFDN